MSAQQRTTTKKYQCRRCGAMVLGPRVQWFAYGSYDERAPGPWSLSVAALGHADVPLCEGCDARVSAVIEAWLDGPNGDDGEGVVG